MAIEEKRRAEGADRMIHVTSGNLLAAQVEALVNTVNTVGVMGKGIALQFKRAYPRMFTAYEQAAKAGDVRLGRMHVWETGALSGPRYIINFPTKAHWRSPSTIDGVVAGLEDLVRVIRELGVTSVAVPPLGCGNGGLDWADVEPRIRDAFAVLPDVEVLLFAPTGPPKAAEMPTNTAPPAMTVGRAAMVHLLSRYNDVALGATPIEVQKLLYFLQGAGEPLRLQYTKGHYGPYADNLRHVLTAVEGHLLSGYGDGSAKALEAAPIQVLPGADLAAVELLEGRPDTRRRIDDVLSLVEGFETRYGLELLASVHWVATKESEGPSRSPREAAELVGRWTSRKATMFTGPHVTAAWEALAQRGWLTVA